ncbi:hypothetical protein DUNSADRAFT_9103 [Dunaliella salina]|uniref:Encoded protein n=1 Tax=Dunaliella salina TaxID=3046 RepID=A0ABQ7H5L5_DUNSA|nr:hypothetical protein DUNSADRAFT_9103 [Dunaliella salina]|eukprot:KAF5842144.1 hypothetical protein DUNSADRAFT_9103 [Dunaliella salina]
MTTQSKGLMSLRAKLSPCPCPEKYCLKCMYSQYSHDTNSESHQLRQASQYRSPRRRPSVQCASDDREKPILHLPPSPQSPIAQVAELDDISSAVNLCEGLYRL